MDPITLGIMALGGGLLGGMFGLGSTASANDANMELAQYQYAKNLEMWNRNNEYNSPKAQMARLSSAGLNPHLVYGGGNVTGNSGSTPPQYQAPTIQSYQGFGDLGAGAAVSAYLQGQQTEANVANTNADTHNKELEGEIKQYQIDTQTVETMTRLTELLSKKENLRLLGLKADEAEILLQFVNSNAQASLANLIANTENVRSQIKYRDDVETPLGKAKTANVEAETEFTKGPKTYSTYASGNASNANAAYTNWNRVRSESLFPYELQSAVDKNVIDSKTAVMMDKEMTLLAVKIRNMGYDNILKLKDAIIKQWQIDYGLPFGLANDFFNTAISGAKLIK